MVKKIGLNALFLALSQIVARGIGFFYFVFLARMLGVSTLGIYSFTLAFVNNFVSVADFGIEKLILRDISRNSDKSADYFSKLFPLRILLCIISYLIIVISGFVLGLSALKVGYLLLFALFLFPNNLIYFMVSFQNAKEKMHHMAVANIATILITSIVGVVFVYLKLSLSWIMTAFFIGNMVFFIIYYFFLKGNENFKTSFVIDFSFIKAAVSQSWVFALLTIVSVFYLRLSILMVDFFKGSYFTGLYSSVFKFIEAGLVFPQALTLALFPISSRLFIEDKKKLKAIYFKGLAILLIVSLLPAGVLFFFSENIVRFSYGTEYLASGKTFSILGLALILFFINSLAGNIIQSSKKAKFFLPYLLLNITIVFFLFWLLIPKFSIEGAAWGVVGGELAGLVINNYFVLRLLKEEKDND